VAEDGLAEEPAARKKGKKKKKDASGFLQHLASLQPEAQPETSPSPVQDAAGTSQANQEESAEPAAEGVHPLTQNSACRTVVI
jgi:hypothetical protein